MFYLLPFSFLVVAQKVELGHRDFCMHSTQLLGRVGLFKLYKHAMVHILVRRNFIKPRNTTDVLRGY